ncbi:MAG: GatB/YqeY domain-containing protein, partial [Proteobacteria bacterium]|nr:GatB/YqeY domain-containing protein [Pseudomonadota bacterium]
LIENLVSQDKDPIANLSLLDTITQDLKTAMISKEVVARDSIRMLLSDIKKYEIDEREEATDAIILTLINKNVKQRRDSIEQFKNGGRADLVTKEEEQLNVILKYLPQQLSVDEIKAIVQQGIDEISAQTMQDMGKLMALLKPQLEGKADMSVVSAAVKELLN